MAQQEQQEQRQRVQAQVDEAMSNVDTLIKSRWWEQEQLSKLLKLRDEMELTLVDALMNEPAQP